MLNKTTNNLFAEDVVYSYLLLVLTKRRVTVPLKQQNIKLATRTKTNVEITEESNSNKRPKDDNLHIFWASPGLISRCQHREGRKRTIKEQTFRPHTNNAPTTKSTWSRNHVTRTRGVHKGTAQIDGATLLVGE